MYLCSSVLRFLVSCSGLFCFEFVLPLPVSVLPCLLCFCIIVLTSGFQPYFSVLADNSFSFCLCTSNHLMTSACSDFDSCFVQLNHNFHHIVHLGPHSLSLSLTICNIFYFSFIDDLPVHANDIAQSTRRDPILSKVSEFTLNGWPNQIGHFLLGGQRNLKSKGVFYGAWGSLFPQHREQDYSVTSMQHRFANFLLMYRSTPHMETGVPPAELFIKRQIVSVQAKPCKHCRGKTIQTKDLSWQNSLQTETSLSRWLDISTPVWVRNFREGKEKWLKAAVVKRLGPVTYLINDGWRECSVHIDHLLHSAEAATEYPHSNDSTNLMRDIAVPFTSRVTTEALATSESNPGPTHTQRTPANDSPVPLLQNPAQAQPRDRQPTPVRSSSLSMRRYPERVRMKPDRLDL